MGKIYDTLIEINQDIQKKNVSWLENHQPRSVYSVVKLNHLSKNGNMFLSNVENSINLQRKSYRIKPVKGLLL